MEEEVLQPVLSEMLAELKEVRKQQACIQKLFSDASDKSAEREAGLLAAKKRDRERCNSSITATMNAGFDQIKTVVEAQPKNVTKQVRIVLFPEYNASEYYKVIGKIFLWLLVFTISTYLFVIGKGFIDANLMTRRNELDASKYKKAWIYLYRSSRKSVRQKMDSVWSKNASNI